MQQVLIDLCLFDPSNITAPFNRLSQDIFIRAVIFSVSDEATREAINKNTNYDKSRNYAECRNRWWYRR